VIPPDVNLSQMDFAPSHEDDRSIAFGLSAVRNVGQGLVELLINEREEHGPFTSFYDFVERVPESVLNKRTIESLIKAGGFDRLGHPRKGLLAVFEQIIDTTVVRRRERDQGVMSLFGDWGDGAGDSGGTGFDERIPIPDIEFDKTQRLRFEKEMLGLYISDHPLMGVDVALRRRVDCGITEVAEREDGSMVTLGGVVTGLTRKFTKKGDQMAVFVLEDLQDSIEVMVFPRVMMEQGHKLADDVVVTIKGRLDRREDTPKLMASDITVVEGLDENAQPLRLKLSPHSLNEFRIAQLKKLLREHPGDSRVLLHLGAKVLRLSDEFNVDLERVIGELRVVFGHDAVVL